jgi:hypothetical protein
MDKELIIIVYKINVDGEAPKSVDRMLKDIANKYFLSQDVELKENYIIREILLPVTKTSSDVKIIYPIPNCVKSAELDELIEQITLKLRQNPDGFLVKNWEKLLRELKLRKLKNNE